MIPVIPSSWSEHLFIIHSLLPSVPPPHPASVSFCLLYQHGRHTGSDILSLLPFSIRRKPQNQCTPKGRRIHKGVKTWTRIIGNQHRVCLLFYICVQISELFIASVIIGYAERACFLGFSFYKSTGCLRHIFF